MSELEAYKECFWSDEGASARQYMYERGFKDEILRAFSIGYAPPGGKFFENRVMFPIFTPSGQFSGFSGRTFDKNEFVKYKNSPESPIFKKTKSLFGVHLAKEAIFKENKAILVEGFTDVLALHQAGLNYTVAGMGTALSEHQLAVIARYTRNILMCFDGDSKGEAAFARASEKAKGLGLKVVRLSLPAGKDPADVVMSKG